MIPDMIDPLGKYWKQPHKDRILVDEHHAVMTQRALAQLNEYSTSLPTGMYQGKMWKRSMKDEWVLCWYDVEEQGTCPVRHRRIIVAG